MLFWGKKGRVGQFSIDKTAVVAVYWWVIMESFLPYPTYKGVLQNEGYP